MDTDTTRKRLSVDLPLEDYRILEVISAASGRTISDLIRRAIPIIRVCHEAKRDGKSFGVADASKLDREVVF